MNVTEVIDILSKHQNDEEIYINLSNLTGFKTNAPLFFKIASIEYIETPEKERLLGVFMAVEETQPLTVENALQVLKDSHPDDDLMFVYAVSDDFIKIVSITELKISSFECKIHGSHDVLSFEFVDTDTSLN